MKQFEILDIFGDAGIRAFGKDLPELFAHAGIGMFSLITKLDSVTEARHIIVTVESETLEGLLIAWLNELVFHFDTYGFVGKKICVTELTGTRVSATVSGEEFDPVRHERGLLIKAATYHRILLQERDDHWEAEVIFDI
jgi:SHS2 domain-containing protein